MNLLSHTPEKLEMIPLNRHNWEQYANLKVAKDQESFIPSNLISIAQSRFEPSDLFGFQSDGIAVGFAMIGYWSGIAWINRIMIDQAFQRYGFGKQAVRLLVQYIQQNPKIPEIRTTVSVSNKAGTAIFRAQGFDWKGTVSGENIYSILF